MLHKSFYIVILSLVLVSCTSTKLSIKNIDDKAKQPEMLDDYTFKLKQVASDKKYGYHQDYPVNLGFGLLNNREQNIEKFLRVLQGPNGEKITYTHDGNCCPFPTGKSELGGGMLDVYVLTWEGNAKPVTLYLNVFEKGEVLIPMGFTAKSN